MKCLKEPSKIPIQVKAARELIARLALVPFSLMENPQVVQNLLKGSKGKKFTPSEILHLGSLVAVFSSMCVIAQTLQIQNEVDSCYSIETSVQKYEVR